MDIFSIVNDFSKNNINPQIKSNESVANVSKGELSDNSQKDEKEKIEKEEIKKMIAELNQELQKTLNTALEFRFNDKVDELVIQVIDKNNEKVIREFPPKEALKIMEKMRELVGLLFDKKG